MKITEAMVSEFNDILTNLGCGFKLKYDDKEYGFGNPACLIAPTSDKFIRYFSCGVTDEFYKMVDDFFLKRGIELHYNNTGSIFWSKTGWNKE